MNKTLASKTLFYILILLILAFFLFPPLFLVSTSLKNYKDAFSIPPKFVFKPTFENYRYIFSSADFGRYLKNSIIISSISTLFALLIGIPAGYALSVFQVKNKENLQFFVLSLRIAPPLMVVIPFYMIFFKLGILGTKTILIIMYFTINLPLVIILMQVYFEDVPIEIREAALIDGCSEWLAFKKIMLPLVKSGLSATTILCIIQSWNEFLFALVLTSEASQTLPVGVTSFMTFQGTNWGALSAAGTVIMIPMIVFGMLVQKNLVKGMTFGAVKG